MMGSLGEDTIEFDGSHLDSVNTSALLDETLGCAQHDLNDTFQQFGDSTNQMVDSNKHFSNSMNKLANTSSHLLFDFNHLNNSDNYNLVQSQNCGQMILDQIEDSYKEDEITPSHDLENVCDKMVCPFASTSTDYKFVDGNLIPLESQSEKIAKFLTESRFSFVTPTSHSMYITSSPNKSCPNSENMNSPVDEGPDIHKKDRQTDFCKMNCQNVNTSKFGPKEPMNLSTNMNARTNSEKSINSTKLFPSLETVDESLSKISEFNQSTKKNLNVTAYDNILRTDLETKNMEVNRSNNSLKSDTVSKMLQTNYNMNSRHLSANLDLELNEDIELKREIQKLRIDLKYVSRELNNHLMMMRQPQLTGYNGSDKNEDSIERLRHQIHHLKDRNHYLLQENNRLSERIKSLENVAKGNVFDVNCCQDVSMQQKQDVQVYYSQQIDIAQNSQSSSHSKRFQTKNKSLENDLKSTEKSNNLPASSAVSSAAWKKRRNSISSTTTEHILQEANLLTKNLPNVTNNQENFLRRYSIKQRIIFPKKVSDVRLGDLVKFSRSQKKLCSGVVKYIGHISNKDEDYLGLELLQEVGTHDGLYEGHRYFQCKPNRGVFVTFKKIVLISRITE